MSKVTCICGQVELKNHIEYDEDGNPTCRQCATELKTEYVAEQAKNAANKNKN